MAENYLIMLFLIYGFSFLLVYSASLIYQIMKKVMKPYAKVVTGIVLGLLPAVISVFANELGLIGMPDGRFLFPYISVIFLGQVPGLITGVLLGVISLLMGYSELDFLIANIIVFYILGTMIRQIYKTHSLIIKLVKVIIGSLIGLSIAGIFVNIMVNNDLEVDYFNDYMTAIFFALAIVTIGLAEVFINEEVKENQLHVVDSLMEASRDGFIYFKKSTKEIDVTKSFCELLGYREFEAPMIGKKILRVMKENDGLIYEEDYHKTIAHIRSVFEGKKKEKDLKIRLYCKDGSMKWLQFKTLITYQKSRVLEVIVAMSDINEAYINEQEIERLAYNDLDTNFKNQLSYLRNDIKYNSNVVFILVKQYELFSNTFGKDYKKKIKKYIGDILLYVFPDTKNIYYIDRGIFAVELDSIYTERMIVDKINDELYQKEYVFVYNESEIKLVMHSVVMRYPFDGENPEELLLHANSAFEYSHEVYSSIVIKYSREIYDRSISNIKISNLLTGAIKTDELSVVFQPQYISVKGMPSDFEALIRWNNKELGFIAPDIFIPIAENMGQINLLDQYVFRKSCQFIKEYNERFNQNASVSVNISFVELIDPTFADNIIEIMAEEEVSAKFIKVEITETSITEFIESVSNNLRALRDSGIDVHLDDFGTGYSSLNHLIRMKVDAIKIDKSFTNLMLVKKDVALLVESIIALAHGLNMIVIAEGIENIEQFKYLKSLSCDKYQGYYFSKPKSQEDIFEWVESKIINISTSN